VEATNKDAFLNLLEVPPSLFASRMSLLVNTEYQHNLVQPSVFLNENSTNLSLYGHDFGQHPDNGSIEQSVVDKSCRLMCTRSTQATITHAVEVFGYNPF
jgi:hypothetical protein